MKTAPETLWPRIPRRMDLVAQRSHIWTVAIPLLTALAVTSCGSDTTGPDGLVLIAGKGSEKYQLVGDRKNAFSDVAVATDYLGGRQ